MLCDLINYSISELNNWAVISLLIFLAIVLSSVISIAILVNIAFAGASQEITIKKTIVFSLVAIFSIILLINVIIVGDKDYIYIVQKETGTDQTCIYLHIVKTDYSGYLLNQYTKSFYYNTNELTLDKVAREKNYTREELSGLLGVVLPE